MKSLSALWDNRLRQLIKFGASAIENKEWKALGNICDDMMRLLLQVSDKKAELVIKTCAYIKDHAEEEPNYCFSLFGRMWADAKA